MTTTTETEELAAAWMMHNIGKKEKVQEAEKLNFEHGSREKNAASFQFPVAWVCSVVKFNKSIPAQKQHMELGKEKREDGELFRY